MFPSRRLRILGAIVVACPCSLVCPVVASPVDDPLRIVGGNNADIEEYPYYVKIPGCGGVLIASEWVLTAKHCGNFEGRAVIVGAHHQSAPGVFRGGAARVCTEYVGHPGFTSTGCEFCPPFENDFALCKLDTPVYVNDTTVTLRLGEQPMFPPAEEEVVAIGFGRNFTGPTSLSGPPPEFLQEVTVAVDEVNCDYDPSNICATSEEKKGICFGDSGGPLLHKGPVDDATGRRTDTHVGVSSFVYGRLDDNEDFAFCGLGRPWLPDVYGRTSSAIGFVQRTICEEGNSRSPFCNTDPLACESETEQKLVVRIVTDDFPSRTNWTLREAGGTEPLLARDDYDQPFFAYEDEICLARGALYEFEIDRAGGAKGGGLYSLILDGKEAGTFSEASLADPIGGGVVFSTDNSAPGESGVPLLCTDDAAYRFGNRPTGKTCASFGETVAATGRKKRRRKRRRVCRRRDPVNGRERVESRCPSLCLEACRPGKRRGKNQTGSLNDGA